MELFGTKLGTVYDRRADALARLRGTRGVAALEGLAGGDAGEG